jgi:hypothetical protein
MRNHEDWTGHSPPAEEEDVHVDEARPPPLGWRAPHLLLNGLTRLEQVHRFDAHAADEDAVEEPGLVDRPDRPSLVQARGPQEHTLGQVVDAPRRLPEIGGAISEVRAQTEVDLLAADD